MSKQVVERYTENLELDGATIAGAIRKLQSYISTCGEDAELYFTCNYEGDTTVAISYFREETEEEYQARLNTNKYKESQRKALYEQLKKEFEGTSERG